MPMMVVVNEVGMLWLVVATSESTPRVVVDAVGILRLLAPTTPRFIVVDAVGILRLLAISLSTPSVVVLDEVFSTGISGLWPSLPSYKPIRQCQPFRNISFKFLFFFFFCSIIQL